MALANESWDLFADAWLSYLLRGAPLLVREVRGLERGPWMLNLGDVNSQAALVWPVTSVVLRGSNGVELVYYKPDFKRGVDTTSVHWLCIFEPGGLVEAMLYEWVSPTHMALESRQQVDGGLCMRPVSEPKMWMDTLASRAFFTPLATLKRLCSHLKVSLEG